MKIESTPPLTLHLRWEYSLSRRELAGFTAKRTGLITNRAMREIVPDSSPHCKFRRKPFKASGFVSIGYETFRAPNGRGSTCPFDKIGIVATSSPPSDDHGAFGVNGIQGMNAGWPLRPEETYLVRPTVHTNRHREGGLVCLELKKGAWQ